MHGHSPRRLLLFLAPAVLFAGLAACREDAPPPTPPAPVEYPATTRQQSGVEIGGLVTVAVGERCVECHEDIVEAYRTSAMHDAMMLPSGEDSLEASYVGKTIVDEETGISYRIGLADGAYTFTVFYVDPLGVERASHVSRIDLIIGSGHATHSYFQLSANRLLQLGLTWYHELDTMALSPGPGYRQRTVRVATRQCVSCHTGELHHVSNDADLGFQGRFSLGITCERCHGESEDHCLTGDPSTTIHPARLPVERQAEVCFQCHLTSAVTVERTGFVVSDFVPGQRLGEHMGIMRIANETPGETSEIAGHGERMKLSACFTESLGATDGMQLTCTTCHNPHRGFKTEGIENETDRGCLVCHQQDACHGDETARQGKACFECHMKTVTSKDIGHTKITDHWIRRTLPEGEFTVSAQLSSPGHLAMSGRPLVNHLDPEAELANAHLIKAKAYAMGVELALTIVGETASVWARRGLAELEFHERLHGKTDETIGMRGRLLTLLKSPRDALPLLEQRLQLRPDLPAAHSGVAFALMALWRNAEALEHLQRAAEIDPFEEVIAATLADLLSQEGRQGEALDVLDALRTRLGPIRDRAIQAMAIAVSAKDYERALRYAYDRLIYLPREPESLSRAGELCRLAGKDVKRARALFEKALEYDPKHVPALLQLADLELKADNLDVARTLIHRAVEVEPNNPHALDLLRRAR